MKTAILTTSDIARIYFLDDANDRQTSRYENLELKFNNDELECYSTGRLEKAVRCCDNVLVVSTRPTLGEHDAWWLELLYAHTNDGFRGKERVFLARPGNQQDDYQVGWRKLWALLSEGEEWPVRHWTQLAPILEARGYILPHSEAWNALSYITEE